MDVSPPRVLRRKRSSANAALTCRPSLLTLGKLVPTLQTCILIHVKGARLVHALFEPNFAVDGRTGRVEKLDRERWERVRSNVEALRLLPRTQGGEDKIFLHPLVGCATRPEELVMIHAEEGVRKMVQALDGDDLVRSLEAVRLEDQQDINNTILALVQSRL